MTPCRRSTLITLALLTPCLTAASTELSIEIPLDLTALAWIFESSVDLAMGLERQVTGESSTVRVTLPAALHTESGAGTLHASVQVADVPSHLQPLLYQLQSSQ